MDNKQINGIPDAVNDFLDSMNGQVGDNPFANAQNVITDELSPTANQPQQPVPAPVQPTATWPTEQVRMPMQQAPVQQPAMPVQMPQAMLPQQAQPKMQIVSTKDESDGRVTEPKNTNNAGFASDNSGTLPLVPFAAAYSQAMAQSEQKITELLAAKKPFFSYGKAKDEIDDTDITFEALREKYETDFPELSDSKLVTWSVSYGKVTKQISNPSSDKVYTVKSEIEKSKAFSEGLKKAKTDAEKNPECLVKPFKKAQTKGENRMPGYKKFCFTKADALKSEKAIVLLPSKDGRLFEIRRNDIGIFTVPVNYVKEFDGLTEKFEFSLPKIPFSLLSQIFGFFKQLSDEFRFEALVHILYDTELQKYCIKVPKQKISSVSVNSESEEYDERFIHVMDIHSHNSMPAVFSDTDNRDEKSTRLYAVAGRFDRLFPELTVRAGCGGKFIPVNPSEVFELSQSAEYPKEWKERLKALKPCKPKLPFFRRQIQLKQLKLINPNSVTF